MLGDAKNNRQGLSIIAIISILVVTISCLIYGSKLNKTLGEETNQYLSEIANQSVNVLKKQINGDIKLLQSISIYIEGEESFELDNIISILKRESVNSSFKRMGVILPDGMAYTTDGYVEDFSKRDYFSKSMQGEVVITGKLKDVIKDHKDINVYSVPIYKGNKIIGVIFATHSTKLYEKILSVPTFNGKGYSYIANSNGDIVLNPSSKNANSNMENLFSYINKSNALSKSTLNDMKLNIKNSKSGSLSYNMSGKGYYLSYAPIGINDWYLFSEVPRTAVSEKSYAIIKLTLSACIVLIVIFTSLIIYILIMQKKSKERLEEFAFKDSITGIGNSNKFNLEGGKFLSTHEKKNLVLIYFDIDKFKLVNDRFGYEEGDRVLRKIAEMIENMFKEESVFSRISNDNFAIIFEKKKDKESVIEICEIMRKKLSMIKTSLDVELNLIPSIGVYFIEEGETNISTCLDKAMIAKTTVKRKYLKVYEIYAENLKETLIEERDIEQEMHDALKNEQFKVYLQPKIELSTGKIVGSEALVRWQHPQKGLISPGVFIPIFEKNGFITELDMFVFIQVCKNFKRWENEGLPRFPISVNLSRVHLENPDFIEKFENIAKEYDIEPNLIEIELTESAIFDNTKMLFKIMQNLKSVGFKISMDDFGSGYSSLNMLKDMPIDVLKLDRQFFITVEDTKKSQIVVSSIVQMAKQLDIKVVSEGVETLEQAEFLRFIGCDMAQGFLFAKPMPIEEYEKLILNRNDIEGMSTN
ncbi:MULTISPECIES: EAL domain-containing protein [unclassified Clostridioides]|uniref:bifunctional diguanylate cyclase/phosphodiesterase n=1 Tax=unclassified Clostridioides TaxID=2635829 RepID=UPI001D11C9B5|nr:EAL domain-containing protein [Clostridioides sp. ES-S-0049-03]MCC0675757.1 EAL domain-containing protein [Clostridioides sp. ES-W-0018-02]MCC0709434.1 EAL domain-containing protein [Clostridioides sp. ES-W-0017-02]